MKLNSPKIKSLFLLSILNSGSANKEKSVSEPTNQTNVAYPNLGWANFFGKISGNSANFTKEKVAEEDPKQNIFVAGFPIMVGVYGSNGVFQNNCTGSFVVINTNSSEYEHSNDHGGFLTSFFCLPPVTLATTTPLPVVGWYGYDSFWLGEPYYGSIIEGNTEGIFITADYLYVSANLVSLQLIPYVTGLTTNDKTVKELYPVTGTGLGSVTFGSKVCAYGAVSGHHCGNLIATDLELTIPSPWVNGNNITIKGLSGVITGATGFESEEDIGGPVYTKTIMGGRTLVQALGHITSLDNSNPNYKSFYYTPIDKALSAIFGSSNCSYALLTYNWQQSTNEELQAQVEVPLKN